ADCTEAIRIHADVDDYLIRGACYFLKNDFPKAIADASEAIRLEPANTQGHTVRGASYRSIHEYEKAVADYTEAARLDPKLECAHFGLASLLATCPRDTIRDGRKAVAHAQQACELTKWKHAPHVEMLATAHAEAGNFPEAVRWEKTA